MDMISIRPGWCALLVVCCLTACGDVDQSPPASVDSHAGTPVPLVTWSHIQQEAETAIALDNIDERIARCYSFVLQYPDHKSTFSVLKALTDALVVRGDYAVSELVELLHQRAVLSGDIDEPIKLVQDFYLVYDLPSDGGLALLELARERIETARSELVSDSFEYYRIMETSRLDGLWLDAAVTGARLHLNAGLPEQALAALSQTEDVATRLMALVSGDGQFSFQTGALDAYYLTRALALYELGRREEARDTLHQSLGILDDPGLTHLYDQMRAKTGLSSDSEVTLRASPEPAPLFSLEKFGGNEAVSLADYHGKVVLLAFWATWCGSCRADLLALKEFRDQHASDDVVVLTINIDRYAKEKMIRRFIDQYLFDLPVLLEDQDQLDEYEYAWIPTLYAIDRTGHIAYVRTGYEPSAENRLVHELNQIVRGTRESGRELLTVELAPPGYGILWKAPFADRWGYPTIIPATDETPGEIVLATEQMRRWSATGEPLETQLLRRWLLKPQVTDLDGDGVAEWVGFGENGLTISGRDGRLYWEHGMDRSPMLYLGRMALGGGLMDLVAGIRDLNDDGFQEIVLGDQYRVTAVQADGTPLWKSRAMPDLETVVMSADGQIVVQAGGRIHLVNLDGDVTETASYAPENRVLRARISTPKGPVDLFGGFDEGTWLTESDLDGDGVNEIVIPTKRGVAAYNLDGEPVLRVRGYEGMIIPAVGDLDGIPGDEIALYISNYGVVVLGRES